MSQIYPHACGCFSLPLLNSNRRDIPWKQFLDWNYPGIYQLVELVKWVFVIYVDRYPEIQRHKSTLTLVWFLLSSSSKLKQGDYALKTMTWLGPCPMKSVPSVTLLLYEDFSLLCGLIVLFPTPKSHAPHRPVAISVSRLRFSLKNAGGDGDKIPPPTAKICVCCMGKYWENDCIRKWVANTFCVWIAPALVFMCLWLCLTEEKETKCINSEDWSEYFVLLLPSMERQLQKPYIQCICN